MNNENYINMKTFYNKIIQNKLFIIRIFEIENYF